MKDFVEKTERQTTDWEKIMADDIPDKGLASKIYEEILKFNNKNINNLLGKTFSCMKSFSPTWLCMDGPWAWSISLPIDRKPSHPALDLSPVWGLSFLVSRSMSTLSEYTISF